LEEIFFIEVSMNKILLFVTVKNPCIVLQDIKCYNCNIYYR